MNSRSRMLPPIVAGTILAFLAGCSGKKALPTPSSRTPVILISIDTLRADHLPAYGYKNVSTPAIDAFRADSILYRNAFTHCPLTLPAHATMLTGRYPADNGVRDNIGFQLNKSVPTLPEALKANGFATGAAVSAFVLKGESGIGRGFDFYEDDIEANAPNQMMGRIQRDGIHTIEKSKEWIAQQKTKPFFFMLHLYEPHSPYTPPEPYKSQYALAYDGEIAYTDQLVGGFLTFLKDNDLYDKSLIIFLSDHGEGLGDHGEEEHGIFLYREAIQIPLMVKLPGQSRKGEEVSTPVQLIDLVPTIAGQTQTRMQTNNLTGSSLLSFLDKPMERSIYSETFYPRFHFGWSDVHSLVNAKHHYIQVPRPELYDLSSDPNEKVNVLTDNRRTYAAMRKELEPMMKSAAAPAPVDPEEVSKLAALGYLGSAVSTKEGEELADPKDKVHVAKEIKQGFRFFVDRNYAEALPVFEKLLKENPRMLDIWDAKARTLSELGRKSEAVEAAKEGLKLSPTTAHLAIMIANISLDMGRLEAAQQHAELVVKSEPGQAHEVLARVWLARGDLARAEKEANLALGEKRDRAVALLTLARIELKRGNPPGALARIEESEKVLNSGRKAAISTLHHLKGDALARLGRIPEAEKEFREEIRFFPHNLLPYQNLILLYATEGRSADATRVIYDLVKASPAPPSYIAIAQTLKIVGDIRGSRYWIRKGLQQYPSDPTLRKLAAG